jgi:hypothetical protein
MERILASFNTVVSGAFMILLKRPNSFKLLSSRKAGTRIWRGTMTRTCCNTIFIVRYMLIVVKCIYVRSDVWFACAPAGQAVLSSNKE